MEGESTTLCEFFDEPEFRDASPDDIFSILEAWESSASAYDNNKQVEDTSCDIITYGLLDKDGEDTSESFEFQKSLHIDNASAFQETDETQVLLPKCKKQKVNDAASASASSQVEGGQQRITHITVERNRRKQMNEHLSVLRSLMPCFYVKRGDQASIIGGVVNYINELQQILQSLEAKKQRKSYNEVLSPRLLSSPRLPPLSPRKPPVSPRYNLPLSPSTPQSSSPYKAWMHGLNSPSPLPSPVIEHSSSCNSSSNSINDTVNELVASSKSASAEVEVKFSGSNLVLKTASHRVPGQVVKVVSAIEELDLEILHVSISTVDETMLNSYTIKIGIECQLSAEELAQQIQKTFC